MAVYQGARLRTTATHADAIPARRARAVAPGAVITAPRARPMGVVMAVIVAATILGLVYLTQTLGSNATGTEIFLLEKERGEILNGTRRLQIQALKLTGPDVIVPKAKKRNLKNLGEIHVLTAP